MLKRHTNSKFVSSSCNLSSPKSPRRPRRQLKQRSHLTRQQSLWAISWLHRGLAFHSPGHTYSPQVSLSFIQSYRFQFLCADFIAIMQQHKDQQAQNEAFVDHFHDLIVLASSYKWSAVGAYHYNVLRSIELSLVKLETRLNPSNNRSLFHPLCYLGPPRKKKQNSLLSPLRLSPGPTSVTLVVVR